ncbi:hypothetical protein TrCOL_g8450 [Triparma columacea]|uniref:Uncharacterized protein n=1 Tax=Triparma columacea TaxID=722753 RepID=A0A9W7GL70_9STRA|nr:hypothetical protein TrCOL_g8450 [Triparma columacea]
MSKLEAQHIPEPNEVLSALSKLSMGSSSDKRPSAKTLLKSLQTEHPDWKISHQRLVKILKKERETSENSQPLSNLPTPSPSSNIFSPNSRARISNADSPVSSKNVLKSRLRPKAALSFVYGAARKMRTPTPKPISYCPYETSEGEVNDPTFVPLGAGENVESAEPWVRGDVSTSEDKTKTPEVVVVKSEDNTTNPTPPSPPTVARTIVSELIKEESTPLSSSSPSSSPVTDDFVDSSLRESSMTVKENTSCFSAFTGSNNAKGSCSLM